MDWFCDVTDMKLGSYNISRRLNHLKRSTCVLTGRHAGEKDIYMLSIDLIRSIGITLPLSPRTETSNLEISWNIKIITIFTSIKKEVLDQWNWASNCTDLRLTYTTYLHIFGQKDSNYQLHILIKSNHIDLY